MYTYIFPSYNTLFIYLDPDNRCYRFILKLLLDEILHRSLPGSHLYDFGSNNPLPRAAVCEPPPGEV